MNPNIYGGTPPTKHYFRLDRNGRIVKPKTQTHLANESIKSRGDIEIKINYNDGRDSEVHEIKNTILRTGRQALAKSLANAIGGDYEFFIAGMLFGNGGTQNGIPKFVDDGRTGLFGLTVVNKGVISSIDSNVSTQAIFTSVIGFNEGNNASINEMGLQMANGDLYSMRTFPDLNKTAQMSIIFNWYINFI